MNVMLTTKEVAQRLRLTVRTLEKWRVAGKGPKYHKAGPRVLYDPDEVEVWLKKPKTEKEKVVK